MGRLDCLNQRVLVHCLFLCHWKNSFTSTFCFWGKQPPPLPGAAPGTPYEAHLKTQIVAWVRTEKKRQWNHKRYCFKNHRNFSLSTSSLNFNYKFCNSPLAFVNDVHQAPEASSFCDFCKITFCDFPVLLFYCVQLRRSDVSLSFLRLLGHINGLNPWRAKQTIPIPDKEFRSMACMDSRTWSVKKMWYEGLSPQWKQWSIEIRFFKKFH